MKKAKRRAAAARARIMEIVATSLVAGTTPHPALLEYVQGKNQEILKRVERQAEMEKVKIKKRLRKKNFYRTQAWLKLRHETLVRYGAKCQACGQTGGRIEIDHIKPRSKYPHLELDPENLQVLCRDCNAGKLNYKVKDWRTNNLV